MSSYYKPITNWKPKTAPVTHRERQQEFIKRRDEAKNGEMHQFYCRLLGRVNNILKRRKRNKIARRSRQINRRNTF